MTDRQRQQRISHAAEHHVDQPVPTSPLATSSMRVPAIVRSLPTETGHTFEIKWQAIRYKDTPPKSGGLEAYGEERIGYPMETLSRSAYNGLVVSGAPTTGSPLVFACRRNGTWILELVGGASSASYCVVASAPSNSNLQTVMVVRLKKDANGVLVPAILSSNGQVVQSQVSCWENTRGSYWTQHVVTGVTPTFIPPTAPVQLLVMIDGVEYIVPTWVDATEPASPVGERGVC